MLYLTRGMSPFKGGIETYSTELTKKLEESNSIEIVTYRHPKRKPKSNIHQVKNISENRSKDFFNYFLSSIMISLKCNFDVIHAANVPEGIVGIAIKLIKRKPLITSVHDTGFVRAKQWSTVGSSIRKYMRKLVCKMSDRVIVPTENIKEQIVKYLKVNPSNFIAVPYGIDKNQFHLKIKGVMRSKLKIPNDMFVIYYSGMFYPKKGLEYAIEAMKYVRKKTDNFIFVIDGMEIFPGYLDKLKSIRDELGLTDKVIFSGLAEEREKWYIDCDVFVLASVDTEGLSLTCLEAGGCGKPVVTTTILEETGAVIKNETALVVPPRDSKTLAQAITKLIENKSLRKSLGEGNFKYSRTFDWEKTKEETEKVYKEVIGG